MRLLQLNVWTLRLSSNIAGMIQQEAPDIVTLQEVPQADFDTMLFPPLSQFTEKIRFHHSYYSPTFGFNFMSGTAQSGNAIISNLGLEDKEAIFTNLEYKDNFTFENDDYNIRNFQHVVIKDENGVETHVINYHGYHIPEHKLGNEFTEKGCRQIVEYANSLEGPVIIAGDFNLSPESDSIKILEERFRNLSTEYGLTTTRNELTHKSEVCDYIFVNDAVKVNVFYMSQILASDHQGLVLDFEAIQ